HRAKYDANSQKKIIAQIATLHSHNITLRNNKKSYNQTTTKKYANTTSYNYQPYTIKDKKWLTISTH
ncbi:TPA: hypothetical protein ACPOJC_001526, partial [Haemophilus influenzae]